MRLSAKYNIQNAMLRVFSLLLSVSVLALFFSLTELKAQDGVLKERSAQIELFKKFDDSRVVVATIRQIGFNDRLEAGVNVPVKFYAMKGEEQELIGESITGPDGKAEMTLPEPTPLDLEGYINLSILTEENSTYTGSEDDIALLDSRLRLEISELDSVRLMTCTVERIDSSGSVSPVEDIEVSFYVKRLFGFMPVEENNVIYTSEDGIAEMEFPSTIKGDVDGKVTIVARVEEDDNYGNLESFQETTWGRPVIVDKNPFPRGLWTPRAPIRLMVVFSIIFGTIWFIYFYMFYSLGVIKKRSVLNKG